jgi:hypothetical protein
MNELNESILDFFLLPAPIIRSQTVGFGAKRRNRLSPYRIDNFEAFVAAVPAFEPRLNFTRGRISTPRSPGGKQGKEARPVERAPTGGAKRAQVQKGADEGSVVLLKSPLRLVISSRSED